MITAHLCLDGLNGQLKSIYNLDNDGIPLIYEEWNDGGVLIKLAYYKNGKLNGHFKLVDGTYGLSGTIKENNLIGKVVIYKEGKVCDNGEFHAGLIDNTGLIVGYDKKQGNVLCIYDNFSKIYDACD